MLEGAWVHIEDFRTVAEQLDFKELLLGGAENQGECPQWGSGAKS
jgi:hypothetical protein